MQKLSQYTD